MSMKPPHPGETLKEEYVVPLGMSVNALAKELGRRGSPQRNRPRPPRRERRHRSATCALLRHNTGALAELAGVLRPAHGSAEGWPDHRAHRKAAPGRIGPFSWLTLVRRQFKKCTSARAGWCGCRSYS